MIAHEVNQLARDIAAIINQYVGPAGEIVVDTNSWTIRLQDGSTTGGHIFAPLEVTDARYQTQNGFLSSLIGLQGQPGFVYVSPVAVGTRALVFDLTEFDINAGALATDPLTIGIKQNQPGSWTFGTVAAGTFTGNLTGNSAGTHTGPVTGNVTGNLTGASNGNHTGPSAGVHTGGLDVRGAALTLDPNQIPNTALSAAIQALLVSTSRLPAQWSIMLWDFARAIPVGWQACDGTNGTVDMRGFFPVGASASDSDFAGGATGGAKTHTHGAIVSDSSGNHTHALTVAGTALTVAQMPAHSHSWVLGQNDANAGLSANGSTAGPTASSTSQGNGDPHTHTASGDTHAGHTHSTTVPSLQALPPFRALVFIQRIAA